MANAPTKITLENLPELTAEHFANDAKFQEDTLEQNKKIHERMDTLATKKDIEEMMIFMKKINVGVGAIRFTWNNAGKIGAILMLIFGIGVFIKYGIAGIIAWFLVPKH